MVFEDAETEAMERLKTGLPTRNVDAKTRSEAAILIYPRKMKNSDNKFLMASIGRFPIQRLIFANKSKELNELLASKDVSTA